MDFKETCDIFGGSIFYDDFRGNLDSIARDLDRRCSQTALVDLDAGASLLLLRAIWNLLSGLLKGADEHLACLIEGETFGRRWAFRGRVYQALVHTWREYPRLFKTCDLSGPAMVLWRKRRGNDVAREALAWCKAHSNSETHFMDSIEFKVVEEVCRVDQLSRWRAGRLNPNTESYNDYARERYFNSAVVTTSIKDLRAFRILTLHIGLPAVSAYLSRMLYETIHAVGDPSAYLYLEQMKKTYAEMCDETGLGLYWLLRGDYNLSPPFTTPVVLNFDIVDMPDEFGGDSRRFYPTVSYPSENQNSPSEPSEPSQPSQPGCLRPKKQHRLLSKTSWRRIRLRGKAIPMLRAAWSRLKASIRRSKEHNSRLSSHSHEPGSGLDAKFSESLLEARRCYDQAGAHFSRGGSARGSAASALHKACSFIMEASEVGVYWAFGSHLSETRRLLDEARDLSVVSGDMQLRDLVVTHRLLSRVDGGDVRSAGCQLGLDNQKRNNEIFSLCLGLLALRTCFYFRYHIGSFSRCQETSEVSRQIFKSMSTFRTLWYQAMLAQVSIWKSLNFNMQAVIWAGHLKDFWTDIVGECLPHATSNTTATNGDDHDDEIAFTFCQHYLKVTVGGILAIDSAVGQPDDFPDHKTLELLDMIRRTYPGDPVTKAWLEQQAVRCKYYKARIFYQRYTQIGELGEANRCLRSFLDDPRVATSEDLQTRAWGIDIALNWGDDDLAKEILSKIRDTDKLSSHYSRLGRVTKAEIKRCEDRRSLKSLEVIFLLCIKLSEWDRASRLLEVLEQVSPGYSTSVGSYTKLWPWQRCLYSGLVREKQSHYVISVQYFMQAFTFLRLAERSLDGAKNPRTMMDSPDVSRLMEALTRRAIRWEHDMPGVTRLDPTQDKSIDTRVFHFFATPTDYSNYGADVHKDEAILFLEAERTQLISESMTLETLAARSRYQMWLYLRTKRTRSAAEEEELSVLDSNIEQTTLAFAAPGLDSEANQRSRGTRTHSICAHTSQELYEAIPRDAIVVYTALSEDGLTVFAIDRTGIKVAYSIPEMTPAFVKTLILVLWSTIRDDRDALDDESVALGVFHRGLSRALIPEPVERCIATRNHVIFIPSGVLARVPFAVLTFNGDHLLMQKQVSQAPSLSALRALRFGSPERPAAEEGRSTVRIIARPGSLADQRVSGHSPLPFAGIEARMIGHMTGVTVADAKNLTRSDFQDYLKEANILHLGTHGYVDADYAFNSSILLGEHFRVADMLAVRTQVSLVTFSACLSGLGHATDLGDVSGFSHAVLAAGANAYLGALWSVDDFATMVHMFLFYLNLMAALDKPSIAEAWHVATRILHGLGAEEKTRILQMFLDCWERWETSGENPGGFVRAGKRKLEAKLALLRTEPDAAAVNFRRPYVWAAFALIGNGSLRIQSSMHDTMTEMMKGSVVHE
jgi:CHAT domain-containing protein